MSYEKLTQVQSRIIIGAKQSLKAMKQNEVSEVFVASDADRRITRQVIDLAKELHVPCEYVDSMKKLGEACGIEVGASVVAMKK